MAVEKQPSGATNEGANANDRANNAADRAASEAGSQRRVIETTTTTTITSTTTNGETGLEEERTVGGRARGAGFETAKVEDLGRRAGAVEPRARRGQTDARGPGERQVERDWTEAEPVEVQVEVEGNKFVTSVATVAVQSGRSRIVAAILRDGRELQLRVQEMRPGVFEVGANLAECRRFLVEHEKLLANLAKHKQAPIEGWLAKYKKVNQARPDMGAELRLVYLCMAENLQGCWRSLLQQLEQRLQLLDETGKFYASAEKLFQAIERADGHVQTFRREFLETTNSVRFNQAANELRRLNGLVLGEFVQAREQQRRLVNLIGKVATGNLADSRANILIGGAQNLVDFINSYIEPLERRKVQLENVVSSTSATRRSIIRTSATSESKSSGADGESQSKTLPPPPPLVREIDNFNDLRLVEGWLAKKVDQLNCSLLSSLGASAPDTRSILNKHEQIALECSAIEEVTLTFRGKSIHALRAAPEEQAAASAPGAGGNQRPSLLEQQRQLASKARDVITILDARIVLLRRTIDFYSRAREASSDINKMMRRLQADNSLQSVQFVSDELELKDVSSVVASGATIISELQQLQLAQQHGQRSKVVGLQLETGGIRAVIDQLNQELAHLKTVLHQRRLVLLNEDASKMAQNFTSKCQQLKFWLDNHARSFLLSNNRIGVDVRSARTFCDQHDELRLAVQQKTLEVEALLRLLSNLTENFDAKSQTASEIQRDTDELRQDWISVTNCLDRRLEIGRKYLAILLNVAELRADIEALDGDREEGRAKTPDARTHEDIEAHVGQSLVQLANQARNFALDAQKSNTALVYAGALETKPAVNDINKQQIVGHANGSLKLLEEQLKKTSNRLKARGPRKWEPEEAERRAKSTTTAARSAERKADERGARTETVAAPKFARHLVDGEVEPFSAVVLECELEPERQPSRVEWLLNNKRIPSNLKHSVASEANRHRLAIGQFSPVCCGTYTALATNQAGVSAASSCKLRLSGIREDESPSLASHPASSVEPEAESRLLGGGGKTAKTSQWRQTNNKWQQQVSKERALERIIQGVESPMSHDEQLNELSLSSAPPTRTSHQQPEVRTSSATTHTNIAAASNQFPVTKLTYDGGQRAGGQSKQWLSFIDSPGSSVQSRSVSRSPFEGTPQPPTFMRTLCKQAASEAGQSAGLVCVVVGNPPPNVEWLHEGRPIASAKCPRPATNPRANICKLTIETINDRTLGQYVCRATNRLGQSATALTLSQ